MRADAAGDVFFRWDHFVLWGLSETDFGTVPNEYLTRLPQRISDAALGHAVLAMLEAYEEFVEFDDIEKHAYAMEGVKSYVAFARDAHLAGARLRDGRVSIEPARNLGRGKFEGVGEPAVAEVTDPKAIGAAVRIALDRSRAADGA